MSKSVGEERVLDVLGETVAGLPRVDLMAPPDTLLDTSGSNDGAQSGAGAGLGASSAGSGTGGAAGGRYQELALIGQGGLGEIVEAFDQDLRRTVALKRPRADRNSDAAATSLVREAQITAQLEHPNIPSVHTLGVGSDGRPYFSMTRLHGASLGELLAARRDDEALRAQLSTHRFLRILAQVAYAVAFAHSRGVLHRDLKPDNIIIGEFGEVRLMDWGIAKVLGEVGVDAERLVSDDGTALPPDPVDAPRAGSGSRAPVSTTAAGAATRVGAFKGTPGYASPEQVEGRLDIDERADVYALGALLYEMIAGCPPVSSPDIMVAVGKTLAGDIKPLAKRTPCSDALAAVVHKALATDREERYANVRELIKDLEAVQEGGYVSALEECMVQRAHRFYFARSPRVARFRNIDVDLACWSSMMLGMALVAGLSTLGFSYAVNLGWLWLVIAAVTGLVPLWTMYRKERPDDPGSLIALSEGFLRGEQMGTATASTVGGGGIGTAPTQATPPDHR